MRIVVDTNVIASAVYFGGKPYDLLKLIMEEKVSAIASSSDIRICRDSEDDKFISCAVDGRCIYIVSGDNDLLSLKDYDGIEIITVAQFFERL